MDSVYITIVYLCISRLYVQCPRVQDSEIDTAEGPHALSSFGSFHLKKYSFFSTVQSGLFYFPVSLFLYLLKID